MQIRKQAGYVLVALLAAWIAVAPNRLAAKALPVEHVDNSFSATMYNDATSEYVDLDVSVKSSLHIVDTGNGWLHVSVKVLFSGRAVGQSSGIVYLGNQTDGFSVNVARGFMETSGFHFSLISK